MLFLNKKVFIWGILLCCFNICFSSENRIISKISFEGNKKIKTDILESIIVSKSKEFLDEDKIKTDSENILNFYKNANFIDTKVDFEIKQVENFDNKQNVKLNLDNKNVVKVIFKIKEGKSKKIKKIIIDGNKNFSKSEIKSHLFSREKSFIRFLSSKTLYYKELQEINSRALSEFYLNNGYLDFKITDYKEEIQENNQDVYIYFTISEGEKYKIENIELNTNNFVDENEIKNLITLKNGKDFSLKDLLENLQNIRELLKDKNISFIDVYPDMNQDNTKKTVDIIFNFTKAKKEYIGKINIQGNHHTYNYVIYDIMKTYEGSIYSEDVIEEMKRQLRTTPYFSNVEISTDSQSTRKDFRDITVKVKEQTNNHIGLNLGYSSNQYFTGGVELANENLFGKAYSFNFTADFSKYIKNFEIGFGKTNIFDTKMFGGFDISLLKDRSSKNSNLSINYDADNTSFDIFTRYNITDNIYNKVYYEISQEQIKNIGSDYVNVLNKDKETTSKIGNSIFYDTRDNAKRPLTGTFAILDLNVAGLGGNKKYYEISSKIDKYFNIYKGLVFKTQLQGGYTSSYGSEKLYATDGFRINGNSFKGFEIGGFGPRITKVNGDAKNGLSAGGTRFAIFNTELQFPFPFIPETSGLYLSIFYNIGILTGVEKNKNIQDFGNRIYDSKSWRSAAGIAVIFATPMGIDLSFEFAKPLQYNHNDTTERFRFNMGKYF